MKTKDEFNEGVYNEAADQTIALGNRLAEKEPDADLYDISDGLIAGAIQYWLYANMPCDHPGCKDCEPVNTSEKRLKKLLQMTEELARQSEYFHSPNDTNAGRA